MKSILRPQAILILLLILQGAARAEDVALMQVQFANKKGTSPVALEFFEGDAPATVENFKKLARKRFYKGLAFHRAFPGILVQTGDPFSAKKDRAKVGTGGPGYTLAPEIRRKHTTGAVAMARLPDKINPSRVSNGSQFFVCLTSIPAYDGQYTVFGKVIYGLETLKQISESSVDSNDYPVDRIVIRSLKIVPREKLPADPATAATVNPAAPKGKKWWNPFSREKNTTAAPPPAPPKPVPASTPAEPKPKKPWWKLF